TWYLKVLADRPQDTKPFIHLQGRGGQRGWMNLDHHPIRGLYPLHGAKRGEIIKDVHEVTVKADFSHGPAKLYWGLFRGEKRFSLRNPAEVPHDREKRIIAATLMIKGKPRHLPKATAVALGDTQLTIDGRLDEEIWTRAPWTAWWKTPRGGKNAPKTRARFLWSSTHLYVAVEALDEDIWSTFTERDSNTWEQEVIELFLDPDGDRKDYVELQVTPANVLFDARFKRHRSDLKVARAWNYQGWETAVHVEGTLNQRSDKDTRYIVEMALPVRSLPGARPITARSRWRLNLFRWDAPRGGRQRAAAFSPPSRPDFHELGSFGTLVFKSGVASLSTKEPVTPTAAPISVPSKVSTP
ncbi:MAG: carbohydrate-binding family 9-like protein, partial [Myxococcota bacterium]|nr:carbohydrate-binding family 9-like protein [Myxococcota bacterium]